MIRTQVGQAIPHTVRTLLVYAIILGGVVFGFMKLPSSFMPGEDQGILLAQVITPAGTSQQRTQEVLGRMSQYFQEKEAENVESVFTVSGFSFGGTGQNTGLMFVRLKDWGEREGDGQDVNSITLEPWLSSPNIRMPTPTRSRRPLCLNWVLPMALTSIYKRAPVKPTMN